MKALRSVRARILLLVLVPTITITALSGRSFFDASDRLEEYELVTELSRLNSEMSAAVHELQKERGRTAGFVGSKGAKFRAELIGQRTKADARIASLRTAASKVNLSLVPEAMSLPLRSALSKLDELEKIRAEVSALTIPAAEAIGFYTSINSTLLDSVGGSARASSDPQLVAATNAFMFYLKAKERAGIERAVLSATFSVDKFGDGVFAKFVRLMSEQGTYFREFGLAAAASQRDRFEKIRESEVFQDVQRMRDVAIARASVGSFGIAPGTWFDTISSKIEALKQLEDEFASDLVTMTAGAREDAASDQLNAGVLGFGTVIVLLALSMWCMRSVLRPIGVLRSRLREISSGEADLTKRIDVSSDDEIGELARSFNQFVENLAPVIRTVSFGADELNGGASEIASASQMLSRAAGEQAASLQQISASLTEIDDSTSKNADHASKAHRLAQETLSAASRSREDLQRMNDAMQGIQSSAKEIEDVIRVIDDIAFQTNLLALNAAVEAARAGDAGKGFAVVAEEVRSLAQRSTDAAKSTGEMIEQSTKRAQHGVSTALSVGQVLETIGGGTQEINDLLGQISKACNDQADGIRQITSGVTELDSVTQKTAGGSQSLASSAQNSAERVAVLRGEMGRFKV